MTEKSEELASRLGSGGSTCSGLLRRVAERDDQAWGELVDLYAPLIGRWCHRYRLSHSAIADVTQEVFITLLRSLPKYSKDRGTFRSWLWTITRSKILDRLRSPGCQSAAQGGTTALRLMGDVEQPQVDIEDDEPDDPLGNRRLIMRALEQVKVDFQPKTWSAFWRSAIDEVPIDVVANELSMSNESVRQARSRVLRRLRQQLGDLG